jgi:hypothetical protein
MNVRGIGDGPLCALCVCVCVGGGGAGVVPTQMLFSLHDGEGRLLGVHKAFLPAADRADGHMIWV